VTFTPASGATLAADDVVQISAQSAANFVTGLALVQNVTGSEQMAVLHPDQSATAVAFKPTRVGSVDFVAIVTFIDATYTTVPLHYEIATTTPHMLTLANTPVASLEVGDSLTITASAAFQKEPIDVTAAATYAARSGTANVFSIGSAGDVMATGPGVDWLDVRYGELTASARIDVGACAFVVQPAAQILAHGGGSASIQVVAPPGCSWTAATTAPWLTLAARSGVGPGVVQATASANAADHGTRVAFVVIGETTASITQPDRACTYAVNATQLAFPVAGGNGSIAVTSPCPITAATDAAWLAPTVAGSSVAVHAAPNGTASTRLATLTIGSQTVAVTQDAKPVVRPWADDPLVARSTRVRALHLAELRTRVDGIRAALGLAAFSWSDALQPGAVVRAAHLAELRTALAEAQIAVGMPPTTYTDPSLGIGSSVRAVHIEELRAAVFAIE